MRASVKLLVLGAIIVSVGCGGAVKKEDFDALRKDTVQMERSMGDTNDRVDRKVDDRLSKLSKNVDKTKKDTKLKITTQVIRLEKKLLDVQRVAAQMQQILQQMTNRTADLQKLKIDLDKRIAVINKKVKLSNENVVAVLEAEHKLLEDRLAAIKQTTEDLKKE